MFPKALLIDAVTSIFLVLFATESAIIRICRACDNESISAYSRPISLNAQA